MQHSSTRLTLILCHERNGEATAVARITDPRVVAHARSVAVAGKQREAAQASDPFRRRKAELEAALIQEAYA
jgi:hypothetical protein